MYLIERLEADRQYAEEALHKEKRRKRFLENKVDSISLWKQQEHSFVVQKGQCYQLPPHTHICFMSCIVLSKQQIKLINSFFAIAFFPLEHEACIRDITELKWQLKLEREKLDQDQEKLAHTEVLNQRLHEDISFAKKQVPIVKENLDLQRGIINQIDTAQAEVTSN